MKGVTFSCFALAKEPFSGNKRETLFSEMKYRYAIGAFIFRVLELKALTEFDEKLWLATIETVTVHADRRMTFHFQSGVEIAL